MKTRWTLAGLAVLAVLGALGYRYFYAPSGSTSASAARPAVDEGAPVSVAPVTRQDVPVDIRAIGSVQPVATVQVRSRVDGLLSKVHFQEGQMVKAGEPIFTLDPRAYEAQIKQAEANLARDQAQLQNARADLARLQQTTRMGATSRQSLDAALANASAYEAAVKADQAALEMAKVQLSYTAIVSPIDGRTGNLNVNEGNLVRANDTTALVTINQLQPIYVAFAVPERHLADIREQQNGSPLPVSVIDSRGAAIQETGKLTFIDNNIDASTGTIQLKATFANAQEQLWPGQFVEVHLRLRTLHGALTVPDEAIQIGPDTSFVYIVRPDNTAEYRPVTTGPSFAGRTVIAKGVAEGEAVVTEGQLRLTPDARVTIRSTKGATNSGTLPSDGLSTAVGGPAAAGG